LVSGCEWSTISGATPLSTDARGSKLLCALGLHWSFSIYDAPAVDKNPFVLSYPSDSNGPREMIHLTATEADFSAQNADSYGSGDNARLAKLDSQLRSTFSALALPRVLNFYARRAGEARDHAAAIIGNKSPTKALARVRKDAAQCIDASVVARELRNYMKNGWVRLHVASLQRRASRGQKKTNLCENIKDTIENSADELLANVESLHSSLNSQANLLSAHANLKLQSWIMCLALFSLLAAALAAIEPATRLYRGEYFQDKQGQQKAPVQTKTSTKPPSVSPARQPPIEAPSPAEATPRTTPAR
jgi:hypothetical protein